MRLGVLKENRTALAILEEPSKSFVKPVSTLDDQEKSQFVTKATLGSDEEAHRQSSHPTSIPPASLPLQSIPKQSMSYSAKCKIRCTMFY